MKIIVGRLVQLIAFLFGLFGGFLTAIAPPEEAESKFAVGLCSVVALLLFLLLSVVSQKKTSQAGIILFVTAAVLTIVAIASGFSYRSKLRALTFEYPPGTARADYIAGTQFTDDARDYVRDHPQSTVPEVVAKYGGVGFRDRVWISSSRRQAATTLTTWYVVFIVSLFGAIFCLTEGVLI